MCLLSDVLAVLGLPCVTAARSFGGEAVTDRSIMPSADCYGSSDVNKDLRSKAKAKDLVPKAMDPHQA